MSPLPDHYSSTLELPFNAACLTGRFVLEPPDATAEGEALWLLVRGGELLVEADGATLRLPSGIAPPAGIVASTPPLHIGRWDGQPCRALALSLNAELPPGLVAESLSAAEPALSIEQLTLGATAAQILNWERNSRHCPTCGSEQERIAGTWGKRCLTCAKEHFPHLHPCVIVVVRRAGEVLLARKAGWPEGRYGLVAGFVDFGEALEETVVREVMEETGIQVRDIRYIGSQAWPFPSQLMAGFTAEYAGGEIRVDHHELEDARWFPLDALPQLPPKRSIARYLIDHHAKD